MNRQEVALSLAEIDKLHRQVVYYLDLDEQVDQLPTKFKFDNVHKWVPEIIDYMKAHDCRGLINFIGSMFPTDYLKKTLKERTKKYKPYTIAVLTRFSESIDKIYECSTLFNNLYKAGPYENLVDPLANERGAELLQRAVKAGFLDEKYQVTERTTNVQKKAIAWAVGQLLELPWRIQWVTFKRQWNCPRFGNVIIPSVRCQEFDEIKTLYPEVDFSPLTSKKDGAFFEKPKDLKRIDELFLSLVTHGYIDPKTKSSQFHGIFNDSDEEFVSVEWKGSLRLLAYFVQITFSPTNYEFWSKAQNCFSINGKNPNRSSLKSASGFLHVYKDLDSYDLCLKSIAEQFNR